MFDGYNEGWWLMALRQEVESTRGVLHIFYSYACCQLLVSGCIGHGIVLYLFLVVCLKMFVSCCCWPLIGFWFWCWLFDIFGTLCHWSLIGEKYEGSPSYLVSLPLQQQQQYFFQCIFFLIVILIFKPTFRTHQFWFMNININALIALNIISDPVVFSKKQCRQRRT